MSIQFPSWVQGPTPCKTRTFSFVLPRGNGRKYAVHLTRTIPILPLINETKGKN